jgi:hypothetical protein
MKALTTRIDERVIKARVPDDCPPMCDFKECGERGRVYHCYTLDYVKCQRYISREIKR